MNTKIKNIILLLIIINLSFIALNFIMKIPLVTKAFLSIYKLIIIPTLISIFIFYLLKPLNNIFLKKGLKNNYAAGLTLIIAIVASIGIVEGLGEYLIYQFNNLKNKLSLLKAENKVVDFMTKNNLKTIKPQWFLEQLLIFLKNYLNLFRKNAFKTANILMIAFSDILLIIIIVFYLLKDSKNLRNLILNMIPKKYKNKYNSKFDEIFDKCNIVLSNYIIGQAKVALSLSSMIYIGYLIIGMPSALILAFVTFILAFIPFVGFFISMIIPYIIAISMGFKMIIKLSLLFIIAQALKGRLIVPLVMSKAMKIHPITDIFLVISAASILGPIGAFIIVPLYSIIKIFINVLKGDGSHLT